ncbi:hypothetical protein MJO28_016831 [Puccinia striiformis f. sp. tritici]|uniref:hypothetical protein n=1 Tax=Puccinia striiformis f. sp. tritici TaxID=168172 RepID=UPI0020077D6D|nr:hypothetical protein Pst134EA_002685 [Puccinia striiformis f. sp. tritici]KAH9472059.1 hypothetical protein Pst134EA_002685 [Puccinia striiformis f. sp. tritici]KAI7935193.1 hypothetical protein MJO28_016831 [Puccinia striiformis f. sp. tritici]KAI7966409.1 hypothetical protein MJO29_002157 [Puccinia striiformis f. sp. tritici]
MASSLQALSNAIKNATSRENPAITVENVREEEEDSEREESVLKTTGDVDGTQALTATGTTDNGETNGGGLRRSTRATSKTPAEPNSSKGATVHTLDPTTAQQTKRGGKKRKAPTEGSELRELLGASHVLGEKGTADDPVDADRAVTKGSEDSERRNLASLLEMALDASRNGRHSEADRFFSILAAFNTKPAPANPTRELVHPTSSDIDTTGQIGSAGCFRIASTTKKSAEKLEDLLLGESSFNDAARPSSIDIGFTAFFGKNLRELKGPLPLTIFNEVWQDRPIAYAASKQARKEDKSDDKSEYQGIGYPDELAQTYAEWSINHQGFHNALIKVCNYTKFAGWVAAHKRHCDRLITTDSFMVGLRYDVQIRFNAFIQRVKMEDRSESVANISVFREDVAQAAYSKARKFDELTSTDNPYAKGGARAGWDPATGAPKERNDSNTSRNAGNRQPAQSTSQQQPPQGPAAQQPANQPPSRSGRGPRTNGYKGDKFNPQHNDRSGDRGGGYDRDRRGNY